VTGSERATPGTAGTDWAAIFMTTLIPLTTAAGFVWIGLEPSDAGDWAHGLLALIPLEYFRAFVLYILSDTYREYRTPRQAVRFFLISLAILIGIAFVISLYVLKGDWWAWITQPDVYRAIAFALALIAVDGVIGVYFFRGDAKRLSVRLEAIADDARDWVQLGGLQLPVVLGLVLGFVLILRESGHGFAWFPQATTELLQSAGLFYAAFYFLGKALLLVPFLRQDDAASRVAGLQHREVDNAIGAEVTKILAQFAPAHDHTDFIEIAECKGPDAPGRNGAVHVTIGQLHDAFGADRLAHEGEVGLVLQRAAGGNDERRLLDGLPHLIGQYGGDFGERIRAGGGQALIGGTRDPAGAEH